MNIDCVVRKIEIEYLKPLRGSDAFLSCLNVQRKGARFLFHQDLFTPDGEPVTKADVTVVVVANGKLSRGDEVAQYFKKYL